MEDFDPLHILDTCLRGIASDTIVLSGPRPEVPTVNTPPRWESILAFADPRVRPIIHACKAQGFAPLALTKHQARVGNPDGVRQFTFSRSGNCYDKVLKDAQTAGLEWPPERNEDTVIDMFEEQDDVVFEVVATHAPVMPEQIGLVVDYTHMEVLASLARLRDAHRVKLYDSVATDEWVPVGWTPEKVISGEQHEKIMVALDILALEPVKRTRQHRYGRGTEARLIPWFEERITGTVVDAGTALGVDYNSMSSQFNNLVKKGLLTKTTRKEYYPKVGNRGFSVYRWDGVVASEPEPIIPGRTFTIEEAEAKLSAVFGEPVKIGGDAYLIQRGAIDRLEKNLDAALRQFIEEFI